MNAFEIYLAQLIYFTNSNSTVLTSSSTALLETLSKCSNLEGPSFNIIKESEKVLLEQVKKFHEIVEKCPILSVN